MMTEREQHERLLAMVCAFLNEPTDEFLGNLRKECSNSAKILFPAKHGALVEGAANISEVVGVDFGES